MKVPFSLKQTMFMAVAMLMSIMLTSVASIKTAQAAPVMTVNTLDGVSDATLANGDVLQVAYVTSEVTYIHANCKHDKNQTATLTYRDVLISREAGMPVAITHHAGDSPAGLNTAGLSMHRTVHVTRMPHRKAQIILAHDRVSQGLVRQSYINTA